MSKLWLVILALVLVNAGVIAALAASGGEGDLTSAVRASAEGEGAEEEEEEGGLGPAAPDDYFLFQRASGGELPSSVGSSSSRMSSSTAAAWRDSVKSSTGRSTSSAR